MKPNRFLLLCLAGFVSVTLQAIRHDYYLITTPLTWSDALNYCKRHYNTLATVQTDDDWKRLSAEAARKGLAVTGWVGLYDRVKSWSWFGMGPMWNFSLINWAPGQPDNANGNESCGAMNPDGYWADYPCADLKPFICYNATSGDFIPVNLVKSWWNSRYYCQSRNITLAYAVNETFNYEILQLVSGQGISWIGLSRGTWTWSDWTVISNLRWKPGFPNNVDHDNSCASVNNSRLVDRPCDSRFYFFCHTPYTVKQQVVKLKIKGDQSVFNPAVQSTILQKIEQKLKDHGLWMEINVTWLKPDGNILHKEGKDTL